MAFNCVFTTTGKGMIPNILAGTVNYPVPNKINWGTGTGTSAATDTTLFTESADEARVTATISAVTTTNPGDTLQIVATQTCATNAKTVTNAGVFDTQNRLFQKADFTGVALAVGDSITFTFRLQLT